MKNIFENLKFSADSEIVDDIFRGDKFRIERILSCGQATEWQDQKEDEWVCLLQGRARILFTGSLGLQTAFGFFKEDKSEKISSDEMVEISLSCGDSIFIPAGAKHKVSYTNESCLWLCVFG